LGPGHAAELGGRIYADSWGVTAFSLEPRYFRDLIPKRLRLQVGDRFYIQTEADDYARSFTTEMRHRTQDSDLGDFASHSIGGKLIWFKDARHTFDFALEYVFRDDGLDRLVASLGWALHW
ncbi:MAG: hypothetical protein OER88_13370, partial [Planctomycetota bacterium]|nr:hypothetical protein [Planctomycetota bacterium]